MFLHVSAFLCTATAGDEAPVISVLGWQETKSLFVTKLPPLGYFSPRGQIAVFQACISSCFYLAKNSLIVLCNSQTHSRRSTYQRDWGLDQASHSGDVWRSRKNIIMNLMSKYLQYTLPSSKRSTVENYLKTPLIASQGPRSRICRKR